MRVLAFAAVVPLLVLCRQGHQDQDPAAAESEPAVVFAPWNGRWSGTFVGYDPRGRELYRIGVEQRYRRVDANTQAVTIRDTMADGTVVEGEGRNTAERLGDGSLRLRCVVTKNNGERVEHDGRVVRGPGGEQQLVWSSVENGRVETFREWVYRDADGRRRYAIHGMGRYGGDSLMLMAGDYRAVR